MKVKKLLLSIIMSIALTVTFIPSVSFAEDSGDGGSGYETEESDVEADFPELTEEEMANAERIEVAQYVGDDLIGEKDVTNQATFQFTPEVSGMYIFQSDYTETTDDPDAEAPDPRGQVLDADGSVLGTGDDEYTDGNFQIYFYAEEGETYYLQAINYYARDYDVVFRVGIAESDVTEIEFEPAGQYVVEQDCDTLKNGWEAPSTEFGDRLTLYHDDGTSDTYIYKSMPTEDPEVWNNCFMNEAGEDMMLVGTNVNLEVDPEYAPASKFKSGSTTTTEATIHYGGCETTIEISVKFMVNHAFTKKAAKAATCKKAGNKAYWECDWCGNYFSEDSASKQISKKSVIIPAAHKWKHIVTKGGLLKNGTQYDQCTVCKAKKNTKAVPGYSTYYVKSFKVKKGKKSFTAKWKKQSKKNLKKFNGYQIRYSTEANMSGAKYATAGKKSKSKKIKGLAKKTKYYVQVRTYTKSGGTTFYSKWSAKKTVKTK